MWAARCFFRVGRGKVVSWGCALPDITLSWLLFSIDGCPLRGHSFRRWAFRRFVGQALLTYGYSDSPPSGTPQPTRGSGRIYTCNTEGTTQTRHNVLIRHRGMMQTKSRPYAARSPRRGLLPIAVGEEDEGRRTYGRHVHTAVRPRRGRISVMKSNRKQSKRPEATLCGSTPRKAGAGGRPKRRRAGAYRR